tara:strand:- start:27 stop:419 length:393 start_codon:yes stop_codon:yes gene_type:complete
MYPAIILVVVVASYFLYQKFLQQQKEIKKLKGDFNKILDIVEPIVENPNLPPEETPAPQPKTRIQEATAAPKAPPYGYRVQEKTQEIPHGETSREPPRGQGVPVDVPPTSGGGVTLEALAGGNNDYAALF